MYGKIFDSIYDGSLYGEFEAIVTLQALVILSDERGYIDLSTKALAGRTSYPLEVIEKGIEVLSQPDPESRSEEYEGRRIIPLEEGRSFGWLVVNKKKYRGIASKEDKRENDRIRIAKKRAGQKGLFDDVSHDVAGSRDVSQGVADVAHTDTDTNTDKSKDTGTSPDGDAPEDGSAKKKKKFKYPDWFELLWSEKVPRQGRQPKKPAFNNANARLKEGHTVDEIRAGQKRYYRYCEQTGKINTELTMRASSFYGTGLEFENDWTITDKKSIKRPAWAKVPRDDNQLVPWAEKHKYPRATGAANDSYHAYRMFLTDCVEKRMKKEGLL